MNDTDKGNSKKNLSHCYCIHHESHIVWAVTEPGPPRRMFNYDNHTKHINTRVDRQKVSFCVKTDV